MIDPNTYKECEDCGGDDCDDCYSTVYFDFEDEEMEDEE